MEKEAKSNSERDKHGRILESARRLLVQRGFQDVALDDIARKARVAKGTLFLYYRNKDGLISAAFTELVTRLGEDLDAVLDSPLSGRALLEQAVRVILRHFERNRDFMARFGAGYFPGCKSRSGERLLGCMAANLGRLAAILRRCAADGLVKGKDLEAAASFLF
ncbi:MAG: TetR/AcrR family transcriptional regulator, partial [Elusimicrobia bacterium]|nr:TetR/AcrR family transcriptional regulator [Elusimicrobiota bacterium]